MICNTKELYGFVKNQRSKEDILHAHKSWDLNDTSNDEVLFTWKMNDTYPILGDGVLSYVGDDGYFHLMDLQSKEDIPLSQYSIPTSDISNISVTPLFADNGHLLIRELNGSECTYFALDTSGDIQTFDLFLNSLHHYTPPSSDVYSTFSLAHSQNAFISIGKYSR